jgi:hypothetical protein
MTDLSDTEQKQPIRSFDDYVRAYFPEQVAQDRERDELPFDFGQRLAQDFLSGVAS